jgi:probable HAF family extracellular repeat protein
VNAVGQIVGFSQNSSGRYHAVLWGDGGISDLGTFSSQHGGSYDSYGNGINDDGDVVGSSYGDQGERAFLWTAGGGMVELGGVGDYNRAYKINNDSEIEGYAQFGCCDPHSFVWTAAAGMLDLGTFGGHVTGINAINDVGQLAGYSGVDDGSTIYHALIWQPAAPNPDANGDGIADTLQPPGTPAGSFSNAVQGKANPTTGSVVSGSVVITDVADPTKGVQIEAVTDAEVSVCGPPSFTLNFLAGMAATITCSSVIVENVTGTAGPVTVMVPGGQASVSFPAGTAGTVSTTPSGGATVTGVSGIGVTMTVGGTDVPVGTGGVTLVTGTAGNNKLNGSTGDDVIVGNGGNDTISGNGGSDTIVTGPGNDTIDGGDGNDTIKAGNGNNSVKGGSGNDTITGGSGADAIDGGSGNDTCTPAGGKDAVKNCETINK